MQPLEFLVPIGALDAWEEWIVYAALALVVLNIITRILAHRSHAKQAERGDEDEFLSQYLPHTVTSLLLILTSFAFLIVEPHGGMVLSVLVLGAFVADVFEFESRRVEARNGLPFERPKGAMFASLLALLYAAYQGVFFVVAPIWNQIV